MFDNNNEAQMVGEREIVFERVFAVPRTTLWRAYTDPERLAQWWGPEGWTLPFCSVDLRVGGAWHYCMRGPTGQESWGKAIYKEIVEPEHLVYTDNFADAEGNLNQKFPELLVTVSFDERPDNHSKLTLHTLFASAVHREKLVAMGMAQGMRQAIDRLTKVVQN